MPVIKNLDNIYKKLSADATRFPVPKQFTSYEPLDSGWSDFYTNGTVSHDTSDKKGGSASIKIVTDGAGSLCGMRKDITDVDWSAKNFRMWVKCTDWTQLAEATILISTSGVYTQYYHINLINFIINPVNNEWFEIFLTREDFTDSGSADWSTANDMVFRAANTASDTPTVWFDEFGAFEEGSDHFVTITFDDGYDSIYDQGKLKMDDYGYRGTVYMPYENVDATNYMTQAEIDELALQGWDISGHGNTNLSTLSDAAIISDLRAQKKYLVDHGYKGQDFYAYPNGAFDENISNIVMKYFSSGRTLEKFSMPTTGVNPRTLYSQYITQSVTTGAVQTMIDNAVSGKSWLVLCFHKIVTTPSVDTEYSIANFGTIIDYLNTNNVNVLPMSEVLRRL